MKVLGIVNSSILRNEDYERIQTLRIAGTRVDLGIVEVDVPHFDAQDPRNDDYALVRVDAFSCNYRDKAIIVRRSINAQSDLASVASPVTFFGSDFVGTVLAKGRRVHEFSVGDRVIPDCSYLSARCKGAAPGVVTNDASRGWLRIHRGKLIRVPDTMNDEVASSFSIGAQTSHSMVRRSGVGEGSRALVLSARSNTSLFIINTLLSCGVETVAATTSSWTQEEKDSVSPAHVVHMVKNSSDWPIIEGVGGFDAVFDPFYDLHFPDALKALKHNGAYITCGFKNQHERFTEATDSRDAQRFDSAMVELMVGCKTLIGNCIGTHEDLRGAVESFSRGTRVVPIDSIFSIAQGDEFLNRTFCDAGRFGKVVLRYR